MSSDGVAVLLREVLHALAFGEVLADQPVGVFVGPAGAIVDRKLMRQVSKATPRNINLTLVEGAELAFFSDQVKLACDAMTSYLDALAQGLYRTLWNAVYHACGSRWSSFSKGRHWL